ncbi:protein dalmatian isoform X3 [Eurosta solidaginis]|uniref:protein dalmatian isoform X3 n=1 Tax=Eurosta solidaginis TaxID=178769 RepID=UPI003530E426
MLNNAIAPSKGWFRMCCRMSAASLNSSVAENQSRTTKGTPNNGMSCTIYENTTLHKQDTQKVCKKVMVKVKRLDLHKILYYPKDKMNNMSTINESEIKPNTRNKRISYKPNEYRANCKCGCAVALQDQSTTQNISKRPREKSSQNAISTKKMLVRLKRTKIDKTKIPRENTKLQNVCKKKSAKAIVRNTAIVKNSDKKKKVNESIRPALDASRFSPVRNSTILGAGKEVLTEIIPKDNSQNNTNENTKDSGSLINSSKAESQKRKNLTNKPDLIEQLLFTDDKDDASHESRIDEKACTNENQAIVHRNNNTHRFFHREPVTEVRPKKVSIFEFPSQSDNSESEIAKHDDPAADIINKLISEGKVRVATNHKGTGRPTLKRVRKKLNAKNKNISKIKRTKANVIDKFNVIKELNENFNADKTLPHEPIPHFDYEEDNSNDAYLDEPNNDYQQNYVGFSRLARSVLLQQTKKNEITRKNDVAEQRRLLEAARKFVSTPATAKRNNETIPDFSPIQILNTHRRPASLLQQQQHPACPSPWRINEDLHLPSVFNFTKNTSYIPTFSSDYIPPSPKKMSPHNNTHIFINSKVPTATSTTAIIPTCQTNSISNSSSQNSSISPNNSNAENMPPPASTPVSALNNDDNAEIFNMRQLPNPRRTLAHRSPLKTINIIEVISLPLWKTPVNNDNEKDNSNNLAQNDKTDETHNVNDLFGFEEFIDEEFSDVDASVSAVDITNANRRTIKGNLRKKLNNLRKWRPKNADHMPNVPGKPTRLFDEDEGRSKQRLIKDMLCSTMINQEKSIPKEKQHDKSPENNVAIDSADEIISEPIEPDFFNEYEPETNLKEKPRRTYARAFKRKRKAHKNVRNLDSGESSTDTDDEEPKELKKMQQKRKRHETRTKDKDNPALESFVNEFNSMCKEVENYELIVE